MSTCAPGDCRRGAGFALRDRGRGAGFTLIELLIAMTLISMLVTVLFASLRLASRTWEATGEADGRAGRTFAVHDWLRRELEQAQPVLVRDESGEAVLAFSGRGNALRFVAPLPSHLGGGGLSQIHLLVEDAADGRRLVMTAGSLDAAAAPAHRRVLAERLSSARFSYFGAREDGEEARWRDEWVGAAELPLLIRLSAQPVDERRVFAPLIARPMTDEAPFSE